jgi:tetratricopeptide (TPR) repeat protein
MIRKDYILRLIEELVRVLARVFQLKDLGQFDEALRLLRGESQRLLGLDGGMMELLAADDIRKALHAPEAGLIAGRSLEEMALTYEATGERERATATGVKALDLYAGAMVGDPGAADEEYRSRISGLADAVAERELTPGDRRALMRCYEALGHYAKAEDALFVLLEEADDRGRVISDGRAFYRRVLERSDEDLAAGGLPRSEANDGIAALERVAADQP